MIPIIAVAWLFVVLLVAVVEATGSHGSMLGALVTLAFWGVLPLAILGYLFFSPARRRLRRSAEAAAASASRIGADPDRRGHPPGAPVAPEREEP